MRGWIPAGPPLLCEPDANSEFRESDGAAAVGEHEKGNFEEARALLKHLKWIERRDREAYAEAACEEAGETFEKTGLAPALTKISRLAGKRKRHTTGAAGKRVRELLSDASGTAYLASETAELRRKSLAEVFTRPGPELLPERPAKARSTERSSAGLGTAGPFVVETSDSESRAAIDRLKPDRAAGEDTATKEHYELLDDVGKQLVVDQARTYWEGGSLPEGVVDSLAVVLAKHGKGRSKVEGWRPIALLNFIARACASLLCLKLATPPHRCSVVGGPAGVQSLSACDRQHADGPTPHEAEEKGGEEHRCPLRTKQGCSLSPLLYSIAASYALERTDLGQGIAFRPGRFLDGDEAKALRLDHLLYTDDIAALAEGRDELETATASLVASFEACGLWVRVNYGKTKRTIFSEHLEQADAIELPGGKIE
eukprot:g17186.t1